MEHNKYPTAIIIMLFAGILSINILVSCKEENYSKIIISDPPMPTTTVVPDDHPESKYIMQSNPEVMLTDRVVYKDSAYVLDLSPKEATELSIPDETYQKVLAEVEKLNQTPKEKPGKYPPIVL